MVEIKTRKSGCVVSFLWCVSFVLLQWCFIPGVTVVYPSDKRTYTHRHISDRGGGIEMGSGPHGEATRNHNLVFLTDVEPSPLS